MKGIPATLDHVNADIGVGKLSRIGLGLAQIVNDEEIAFPGPWAAQTDPERIKTALVLWIERLLSSLESKVMGRSPCPLSLEGPGETGDPNEIYLRVDHPFEVDVLFCDILPKIGVLDQGLERVVISALQMLCWFMNTYTYDDCFEQFQDWSEAQMSDAGVEADESEAIKNELIWIEHHIPGNYRFLLRMKERPEFPPFPECPPASAWTHLWWHWAKSVFESSRTWNDPMPYFPPSDLIPDPCLLDPGMLTPLLWSPRDPLTEYFSEMMDSEYQGGSEPYSILPFNNAEQISASIHLLKRSSEWRDLFFEGARLPDPPQPEMQEEGRP